MECRELPRITYLSVDPVTSTVGTSQVLAYVERLAERGVGVDLHSFEHNVDEVIAADLVRHGVVWTPHRFGGNGARAGLGRVIRLARSIRGAELVHARSDMAAAAAMWSGAECWLWDVRSFWADQKVATGVFSARSPQARVFRRIERRAAVGSRHVVTLTPSAIDELDRRYDGVVGPKSTVVTTCVDRRRFKPAPMPPTDPVRLLLAGTLNRYYDVPVMLDLIAELRTRRPVELVVASHGGTDWDPELDGAGAVRTSATTGEMPALIASCHAGLSVCRDDAGISLVAAMPTKIGEFLAVGRPVIVNPGLQDAASMVDQADAGVVVDASAAGLDAAATRLLELLDDEATPGRATGLAAGFFDLDAGVDRLVEAYRRMSAGR
jgi:glycosyltransferase involved in cell wall biosynthesis